MHINTNNNLNAIIFSISPNEYTYKCIYSLSNCMNWTINNFVTCAMYVHLLYKSDSSYTIGGGGSVEVNNVLGAMGDDDNILVDVDDDGGDDE